MYRSKWMLDLKDLRATDNGNFTCQVFNEYGSINATFQLIVYGTCRLRFN